ncbi:MAG: hypothetical protein ACLQVY_17985 [Limisphaerales bacterium]
MMLKNEPVEFAGSPRRVNVSLMFQHEPEGRIYVSGFCRERAAIRTFAGFDHGDPRVELTPLLKLKEFQQRR